MILLLILGCSMDLAPDNGKTDFIYSALEIIDTCDQTKSCSTSSHGGGKYSARKKRQTGAILVDIFFDISYFKFLHDSILSYEPETRRCAHI